ncbi:PIN domain-containing protein [Geotalea daltonii]|uniref:PIN domain-containing protein n=1 Tax=Geotalea daltonii TaxID=1203471 RepID=UPI00059BD8FA|nr:PIN domain-containing protein [Geotalea daltonii]
MNGFEMINVFIDTSIFIKMNFFYGHPTFAALIESVKQGRTRILLTEVTVEEVKANIRGNLTEI